MADDLDFESFDNLDDLDWSELEKESLHARSFTLRNLPRRLAGKDPWAGWRRHAQGLARASERLGRASERPDRASERPDRASERPETGG